MVKEKIKLIKITKLKGNSKKYSAEFEIVKPSGKISKKTTKFGAAGMSDFTIHKDTDRRERYISRHKKDLKTGNPTRAGYLSMYVLWNKPSFSASVTDYKRRLNTYNKTGNFPIKISGSKLLKFGNVNKFGNITNNNFGIPGASIPFEETSLRVLPQDIQRKIRKESINKSGQNMDKMYLKNYLRNIKSKNVNMRRIDLNMVLDPLNEDTLIWLRLANNILTKKDFKEDPLWSEIIIMLLYEIIEIEDNNINNLSLIQRHFFEENIGLIDVLVKKIYDINIDFNDYQWAQTTINEINEANNSGNYFGIRKKINNNKEKTKELSKIPDNVVNKQLYLKIKNKIKREIGTKRRWGAYDSGRLVREYKAKGGKYSGKKETKNTNSDLSRWYKEKWIDACAWPKKKSCGRSKASIKSKVTYCRPSIRIDKNTPKTIQELAKSIIKKRCKNKNKNPKKIIRK